MDSSSQELAILTKARRELKKIDSVEQAKEYRDKAEAIRNFFKQANESLELQNDAAEVKLRAQRRMGELIAAMDLHGGDRKSSFQAESLKLKDLGVSYAESSRCQSIARIDEPVFEVFISETKEARKELTSSAAYRLGKKATAGETTPESELVEGVVNDLEDLLGTKFGTIYADPPWQYGNQGTRAATGNHYKTMTIDELCEMPVLELAADAAHLHLWTTNAFLFDARQVMTAWGFEYKSCFVWVKPQMGIGNYWRVSHEFLLLGVRGDAKHFAENTHKSWAEYKRGRHSAKPAAVREIVERVSPGPYLELFGRNAVEGWTVFGNQVNGCQKTLQMGR